jgi:HD-GYP domain-containing protein (c-di-GMP phosphodiesterase class II)
VNTFSVGDLQDGFSFTEDAYLDKKFILLTPGESITPEFKKALRDWDFPKIFSEGYPADNVALRPGVSLAGAIVENMSGEKTAEQEKQAEPTVDPSQMVSDEERMTWVEKTYYDYQSFIADVYTRYVTKKELQLQVISDKVKELCEFVKEYRKFILRIQPSPETREKNYLVIHSMRSTIYALVIGIQLKFPIHKQIELGVSCILHEIGMVRLPPQVYMGNKVLTPAEKNAILTHPVISYNILREFSFPLNICLGVLEHHERENGAGYPRKLAKDKISIYAKIIAVACSYEAVTAPRPYKEARDAYSGIIDIMKNQGKQYDETIIRALLFSLSLYPIGLYVLLSNNKIGQVVDVNPENPKYPIVEILGEVKADGSKKIFETSEYGLAIARPLTKEEGAALIQK